MYQYKDKPFIIYRKNEIYPLNDEGFEKYISLESHNTNYLKLLNPKVYRHVFNMNDPDIPEGMRLAAEHVRMNSKYDGFRTETFNKEEEKRPIKIIENTEPIQENTNQKAEVKKEEIPKKEEVKIEPKSKTYKKPSGHRRIFTDLNQNLPPISLKQSYNFSLRKRRRNRIINTEVEPVDVKKSLDVESIQQKPKRKLRLPEIMKTSIDFNPIITTIRTGNQKEFGPKYCPFSSYIKTGDYIGTNVFGAKFNH